MAKFKSTVITSKGLLEISKSISSQSKVTFTKIQTSSKKYSYDSLKSLTQIDSVNQTTDIESVVVLDDLSVNVKAIISNKTLTSNNGYYIETIGLLAKNSNNEEYLHSVTIAEVSDFFPANTGNSETKIYVDLVSNMGQSENVTIMSQVQGAVLYDDFNKFVASNAKAIADVLTVANNGLNNSVKNATDITNLNNKADAISGVSNNAYNNTIKNGTDITNLNKKADAISEVSNNAYNNSIKNETDITNLNTVVDTIAEISNDAYENSVKNAESIEDMNIERGVLNYAKNAMINSSFLSVSSGFATSVDTKGYQRILDMFKIYTSTNAKTTFTRYLTSYLFYQLCITNTETKEGDCYIETFFPITADMFATPCTFNFQANTSKNPCKIKVIISSKFMNTIEKQFTVLREINTFSVTTGHTGYPIPERHANKTIIKIYINFNGNDTQLNEGESMYISRLQFVKGTKVPKYVAKPVGVEYAEITPYIQKVPLGYAKPTVIVGNQIQFSFQSPYATYSIGYVRNMEEMKNFFVAQLTSTGQTIIEGFKVTPTLTNKGTITLVFTNSSLTTIPQDVLLYFQGGDPSSPGPYVEFYHEV